MPTKRNKKNRTTNARKPFWEGLLEWILGFVKKLVLPGLAVWLIAWLWAGGIFAQTGHALWHGFVSWTAAQGVVVTDIIIRGRDRTDIAAIQQAAVIRPGDPLLGFDVDETHARIEGLDWVASAKIRRQYNGLVIIELQERIPFALWDSPGRDTVVIDARGNIIEAADPLEFQALLTVRGVDAPAHVSRLMRMLAAEPEVARHIRGAEWIGDRRWDLVSVERTRIYLPENDIGFALSRLARAQEEKDLLSRRLVSIDLRLQDRIIIESQKGEASDLLTLSGHTRTNAI